MHVWLRALTGASFIFVTGASHDAYNVASRWQLTTTTMTHSDEGSGFPILSFLFRTFSFSSLSAPAKSESSLGHWRVWVTLDETKKKRKFSVFIFHVVGSSSHFFSFRFFSLLFISLFRILFWVMLAFCPRKSRYGLIEVKLLFCWPSGSPLCLVSCLVEFGLLFLVAFPSSLPFSFPLFAPLLLFFFPGLAVSGKSRQQWWAF